MMQLVLIKQKARWIKCLSGALALLSSVSAAAQIIPARFLLTSAQVVTAMQNRQLPTEDVQVKIPAPITASIAEAALDVQSVTLLSSHTAQLKMVCKNHSECLPFYISATWPDSAAPLVIPPSLQHGSHINQLTSVAKQESAKPVTEKTASPQADISSFIHPGASATLLMDHDRIHLRLHVVCLEKGVPGDKVRVTTPDHKQAYVAEIVTPTLLKGSF